MWHVRRRRGEVQEESLKELYYKKTIMKLVYLRNQETNDVRPIVSCAESAGKNTILLRRARLESGNRKRTTGRLKLML